MAPTAPDDRSWRPDVDLAALQLLVGIAETGSLGQSARRLGMAQPNASRALARLEARLHVHLVQRSPRGSTLTTGGRLVADWAAPVLDSVEQLLAGVESLRADAAATLTVGASLTIGEHLAPIWLGGFRNSQPGVQVKLHVANSAEVIDGVTAGRLDVGFIETPDAPSHLNGALVARDELVLIIDPGHRWARRRRPICLDELAGTPLVVREPGSGTRRTVEELLAGRATALPVMELSSTAAIVHSVATGAGPAVVSSLAVQAARRAGLVTVVPIERVRLRRDLRAIWRGTRLEGPAGDFVRHAQSGGRDRAD